MKVEKYKSLKIVLETKGRCYLLDHPCHECYFYNNGKAFGKDYEDSICGLIPAMHSFSDDEARYKKAKETLNLVKLKEIKKL